MSSLKAEIFTLCDYATVSREQKLSIIDIFNNFFVAEIPTHWPKMFLVAVLSGEAHKEYGITLKITPPSGEGRGKNEKNFPEKEIQVTLGPNGKANIISELVNFPLPETGTYKVEILEGKTKVASMEFKVNKTTATYSGQNPQKIVN